MSQPSVVALVTVRTMLATAKMMMMTNVSWYFGCQ